MKVMEIEVPNCKSCPNIRNEQPRLYCFTCSAMDNKIIHSSNREVYGGFQPKWCPLEDKVEEK